MSTERNPMINCPFCPWSRRAHQIANHFLKHHTSKVQLRPKSTDHSIFAYVIHDTGELDFCGCLTCGKGTVGDGITGYSSWWVEMHSLFPSCKDSHTAALMEFKALQKLMENEPTDPSGSPSEETIALEPATMAATHLPITAPSVLSVTPTVTATVTCTGYVYCFVNESMPGLAKIGMTTRTPQERLDEANASDTWKPPTPYTIAFAKSVTDPKAKERTVHKLLEKYVDKIHKRREFFRIAVDDARLFFDLMDGTYWASTG